MAASPAHAILCPRPFRRFENLGPGILVDVLRDADFDAMRRRAVHAGVSDAAFDHAIAPDIAVPVFAICLRVNTTADVGLMPALNGFEIVGGALALIELSANPNDNALVVLPRRFHDTVLAGGHSVESEPQCSGEGPS